MDGSKREPLHQADSNTRSESTVDVKVPSQPLLLFRPETAEIIEVDAEHVPVWLEEIAYLDKMVEDLAAARAETQACTVKLQQQIDPARRAAAEHKLKQAINSEAAARDTATGATKQVVEFNKNAALWEVLPLRNGGKLRGKKMTYVRSDKVKNHLRSYKLSAKDQPNLKSFLTRNDKGEWKLDDKKLKSAFLSVKPKLKTSAKDWKFWESGVQLVPEFAKAFNDAAKFGDPAKPGDMTEFTGGATLLRLFAGTSTTAGISTESDSIADALAGKGKFKAAFKARGEAGVMLAEAKADFKLWLPCQQGFNLYFPDGTREGLNLGYYRASISAGVGASCGASLLAEGGAELSIGADGQQELRGSPAGRTASALGRPRLSVKAAKEAVGADLGAQFTAFAGVQAEAKLGGSFDWRRPEETGWRKFAEIEASASALAGAGGTAAFNAGFSGGMLRVYAKLGACVGVGLKGGCEAAVGALQIAEFVLWYKHQVSNSLDRNIGYFSEQPDFERFCMLHALAIVNGESLTQLYAKVAFRSMRSEALEQELLRVLQREGRAALERIAEADDVLLETLAETKGYLLQLLDNARQQVDDSLELIRRAAGRLFSAAQTRQEIHNIYQFTNARIAEKNVNTTAARLLAANLVGDGQLAAIESTVRAEPAPGYRLAFNDTFQYRLQRGVHVAWNSRQQDRDFSHYA